MRRLRIAAATFTAAVAVSLVSTASNQFVGPAFAAKPQPTGPTQITTCGIIDQPGSYVLVNNLTANGDCLVIDVDSVTINLGGFTIEGNGTGEGVTDGGLQNTGTTIRDGTVRGFGTGINLSQSIGVRVERVQVLQNLSNGIIIGQLGVLQYNLAVDNDVGVQAQCPSNAIGNSAWDNVTANFNFVDPGLCVTVANHNALDFGTCGADLNEPCAVGTGACERRGVKVCTSHLTASQCSVSPGPSNTEICNYQDDDCDGSTDEDFTDLNTTCFAGYGVCLSAGIKICAAGGSGTECSATPNYTSPYYEPHVELTCDGLDNNCDGQIDEGLREFGVCI